MTLLQIYQFAEKQGISIDELNMGHSVAISLPQGWIAIDPKRLPTQVEKKECLAHELGHVETGAFYNVDSPCDIRGKHEIDTPHGESRGILGSTTTACPCEVLHGVPERIGLGVSRPTIYADYANRRSPSLRMFVAAFMSLSWCSPHSGQTHSRTARSFVPVH